MTGAEILIAGAAVTAYGAYASGQAKANAMKDQAEFREQQAFQSYLAGEREARITLRKGELFQSAQIASMGQSGTAVGVGSNLTALETTAALYKEEAIAIRQAAAFRSQNSSTEAAYDRKAARETENAIPINIATAAFGAYNQRPSDSARINRYSPTGSGEFG